MWHKGVNLTVEIEPGIAIDDAAMSCLRIAMILDVTVVFLFNTYWITVLPFFSVADVVAEYESKRTAPPRAEAPTAP